MALLLASGAAAGVTGSIAWTQEGDSWVIVGRVEQAAQVQTLGGVYRAPWAQGKKRLGEERLAEILGITQKSKDRVREMLAEQTRIVAERIKRTEAENLRQERLLAEQVTATRQEISELRAEIAQTKREAAEEEEAVAILMIGLI